MDFQVNFNLNSCTRDSVRQEVVNLFLNGNPGTGKGESCSKYNYLVETYKGYSIHLKRPANLNKGFDFTVHIKGCGKIFGKRKNKDVPTHDNIIEALKYFKINYSDNYSIISEHIEDIYNCRPITLNNCSLGEFKLPNSQSFPIEIILLSIKWLFVEQDITYWNWSGRKMLYDALKTNDLIL